MTHYFLLDLVQVRRSEVKYRNSNIRIETKKEMSHEKNIDLGGVSHQGEVQKLHDLFFLISMISDSFAEFSTKLPVAGEVGWLVEQVNGWLYF